MQQSAFGGAEEGSSSVTGSGDGEGQCKGGTVPTSRSAPTGPGIESKQISSEGATAKQGSAASNSSADHPTPSDSNAELICSKIQAN